MECAKFQISVLRKRVVSTLSSKPLASFWQLADRSLLYQAIFIKTMKTCPCKDQSSGWLPKVNILFSFSWISSTAANWPRFDDIAVIHNNKQGYSAKADIWSLGCICIEMLAGSRPWEGEGFMGAMFKVRLSFTGHSFERSRWTNVQHRCAARSWKDETSLTWRCRKIPIRRRIRQQLFTNVRSPSCESHLLRA